MQIEVVRISADGADLKTYEIKDGATAADALAAAGVRLAEGDELNVHGRRTALTDVLEDGDRLAVAPKLIADPRRVREARAREQGDVREVTCGRHGGKHRLAR